LKTIKRNFWWHGPSWLRSLSEAWPSDEEIKTDIVEKHQVYFLTPVVNNGRCCPDLLSRFSSFTRLIRVTAYCLRWLHGAKLARGSSLSKTELDDCSRRWLNIVQKYDFSEKYSALSKGNQMPRRSPLSVLRPFLSTDGLIRLGGQLVLSSMDYAILWIRNIQLCWPEIVICLCYWYERRTL